MRNLVKFINNACGLHRQADGRLMDYVGVMPELDETVKMFLRQPMMRPFILAGVTDATYRYLMQLVLDHGPRYLYREAARLRLLLDGNWASRVLQDESQQRLNVLQAVLLPQISLEKQTKQ